MWTQLTRSLRQWVDNDAPLELHPGDSPTAKKVDWVRVVPFIGLHLVSLGVIWVGWSWIAVAVAVALYAVRMFSVTGFYHRYFSHRSFRTGRVMQFIFAVMGNTAVQRGALWWASQHRRHHQHSDGDEDAHSPTRLGLWWSHTGWFLTRANYRTHFEVVKDLAKYAELRFLNRFDSLVPLLFFAGLLGLGALLNAVAPGLHTSGMQMLVWGAISTVVLQHATFTVNSLAHTWGKRRFATPDTSRNNLWLALLTLGEGWHNNHHHYPVAARQGFYWWEIDITYLGLRGLALLGLIHDLRPVPVEVLAEGRRPRR